MGKIFKHYETFYNMVLSTIIMSNAQTPELKIDSQRIIEFIGKAYMLCDDLIEECKSIILEQLIFLGLTNDIEAARSDRKYDSNYSNEDVLFEIKGDALEKLQNMGGGGSPETNSSWFNYSHYKTYQADVRFTQINIASATGNLIATRQIGILKVLGIGCEVNAEEAIRRLSQCMYWGDIPSMHLLAYTYLLQGNKEKSEIIYELASLAKKYLYAGYTVLPDEAKENYSEEARIKYIYISSIKQDIINANHINDIDFSFVEALTSPSLDYFKRMDIINNYAQKEWKNITNSSEKPSKPLGFN